MELDIQELTALLMFVLLLVVVLSYLQYYIYNQGSVASQRQHSDYVRYVRECERRAYRESYEEIPDQSCVDEERSCVDEERSCVDEERSCVDEERSCVDEERSCVDEEMSCVDVRRKIRSVEDAEIHQLYDTVERKDRDYPSWEKLRNLEVHNPRNGGGNFNRNYVQEKCRDLKNYQQDKHRKRNVSADHITRRSPATNSLKLEELNPFCYRNHRLQEFASEEVIEDQRCKSEDVGLQLEVNAGVKLENNDKYHQDVDSNGIGDTVCDVKHLSHDKQREDGKYGGAIDARGKPAYMREEQDNGIQTSVTDDENNKTDEAVDTIEKHPVEETEHESHLENEGKCLKVKGTNKVAYSIYESTPAKEVDENANDANEVSNQERGNSTDKEDTCENKMEEDGNTTNSSDNQALSNSEVVECIAENEIDTLAVDAGYISVNGDDRHANVAICIHDSKGQLLPNGNKCIIASVDADTILEEDENATNSSYDRKHLINDCQTVESCNNNGENMYFTDNYCKDDDDRDIDCKAEQEYKAETAVVETVGSLATRHIDEHVNCNGRPSIADAVEDGGSNEYRGELLNDFAEDTVDKNDINGHVVYNWGRPNKQALSDSEVVECIAEKGIDTLAADAGYFSVNGDDRHANGATGVNENTEHLLASGTKCIIESVSTESILEKREEMPYIPQEYIPEVDGLRDTNTRFGSNDSLLTDMGRIEEETTTASLSSYANFSPISTSSAIHGDEFKDILNISMRLDESSDEETLVRIHVNKDSSTQRVGGCDSSIEIEDEGYSSMDNTMDNTMDNSINSMDNIMDNNINTMDNSINTMDNSINSTDNIINSMDNSMDNSLDIRDSDDDRVDAVEPDTELPEDGMASDKPTPHSLRMKVSRISEAVVLQIGEKNNICITETDMLPKRHEDNLKTNEYTNTALKTKDIIITPEGRSTQIDIYVRCNKLYIQVGDENTFCFVHQGNRHSRRRVYKEYLRCHEYNGRRIEEIETHRKWYSQPSRLFNDHRCSRLETRSPERYLEKPDSHCVNVSPGGDVHLGTALIDPSNP